MNRDFTSVYKLSPLCRHAVARVPRATLPPASGGIQLKNVPDKHISCRTRRDAGGNHTRGTRAWAATRLWRFFKRNLFQIRLWKRRDAGGDHATLLAWRVRRFPNPIYFCYISIHIPKKINNVRFGHHQSLIKFESSQSISHRNNPYESLLFYFIIRFYIHLYNCL